jgi:peptide/nickel transport system permease protein
MSEEFAEQIAPHARGYWTIVWAQFKRRKLAVASLILLIFLGIVALFAPFIAGEKPIYLQTSQGTYLFPNVFTYSDIVSIEFDRWEPAAGDRVLWPLLKRAPYLTSLADNLEAPGRAHLLGTDDTGRDVLARLIWGTRISMSVGFIAVGISLLIGILLGSTAGYFRGAADVIILRVIETMLCFPSLIIILALIAFLGRDMKILMIVIGIIGSPDVARLVRGEFLRLRESDYAVAARATGLGHLRIMLRHILPNALAPVLVSATFGVAGAILTESALSFLGLGVPPPTASWGEILSQSKRYVDFAWWLVVFPGAAIFITVTAFNLVGEGLRDAMDPRLRE